MLKRPTRGRDRCSADEEIITFNGWSFVLRQIVAKNVSKELQPPPHIYEKKWRAITHSWISPLGAFSRLAHCRQSKMAHNFECDMSFEIAINRSKDLTKLYARLFVVLLSNVAYFESSLTSCLRVSKYRGQEFRKWGDLSLSRARNMSACFFILLHAGFQATGMTMFLQI